MSQPFAIVTLVLILMHSCDTKWRLYIPRLSRARPLKRPQLQYQVHITLKIQISPVCPITIPRPQLMARPT